jgi:hypothetical protein
MKIELRALCNGKTLAFQAKDAGSIPAARSKILSIHGVDCDFPAGQRMILTAVKPFENRLFFSGRTPCAKGKLQNPRPKNPDWCLDCGKILSVTTPAKIVRFHLGLNTYSDLAENTKATQFAQPLHHYSIA